MTREEVGAFDGFSHSSGLYSRSENRADKPPKKTKYCRKKKAPRQGP